MRRLVDICLIETNVPKGSSDKTSRGEERPEGFAAATSIYQHEPSGRFHATFGTVVDAN